MRGEGRRAASGGDIGTARGEGSAQRREKRRQRGGEEEAS